MSRPVILDMDPGVDDALGIILALRSPELEVLGVSIVSGNVPLDQGADNALKVLNLLGRSDVPVFMGAARPLKRSPVHALEVHGSGGLGHAQLPDSPLVPHSNAVEFIIRSIQQRPGELTLVATGPLTNLALAEAQQPGVLNQARRILVMGGAVDKPGNVTPASEFNFYADPHAAHAVLRTGANLMLIPLDVTHQVSLAWQQIERLTTTRNDSVQAFCRAASQCVCTFQKEQTGLHAIYLHDPLAVGMAIQPDFGRAEIVCMAIDTDEGELAGRVVRIQETESNAGAERYRVECLMEIDAPAFLAQFTRRVLS